MKVSRGVLASAVVILGVGLLLGLNFVCAQEVGKSQQSSTAVSIVERGPHYAVIQSLRQTTNSAGQTVTATNRYTTIQSGLNRKDELSGQWVECNPVVQAYADAIVCTGATYRVILNRNLNTSGAIDLELNGRRIVSHPLGIGFFDPETGHSVLLAQVKDCEAVISSNRVVFPDAFEGSGIQAAITYSYDVGRFAQDVTFLTKPSVTPADFGMGSRTRLEVMTEILESPLPTKTEHVLKRETNEVNRTQMAEPDLVNETIRFGEELLMPLGRAFKEETSERPSPPRGIPVAKRLLNIDGRSVLVEAVEWETMRGKLPPLAGNFTGTIHHASIKRQLPARHLVLREAPPFETRLSQVTRSRATTGTLAALNLPEGFVIDYEIIQNGGGPPGGTFLSGETYLIENYAGPENPVFQAGAIIKYNAGASMFVAGTNLTGSGGAWPVSDGRVVFTAKDDDSVGARITNSTGNPSGYYAGPALCFEYVGYNCGARNVDIRHATIGIQFSSDEEWDWVLNSRFVHCDMGIYADNTTVTVEDTDFCDVNDWWDSYGSGGFDYDNLTECVTVSDSDYDGMPDDWEEQHFGNLSQNPDDDYDGDGVSNGEEYELGYDPNTIAFSPDFGSRYLSVNSATGSVMIVRGLPAEMAVLVNNTNFSSATWHTFNSNLVVNLGSTDGVYRVWIGLRGRVETSEQTWQWVDLTRDTVAPLIVITNPAAGTTSQPFIQLQGYSIEPLSAVEFDITNASGSLTNLEGFVMEQYFDTNAFGYTTNWFQCFDVELTNGLNTITLRAVDLAGNVTTTNVSIVLDYTGDTNPPVFTLIWPEDSALVSGDQFTMEGLVDDVTASVTATMISTNGETNIVAGLVERSGKVSLIDLPLWDGTNAVVITTKDAAGNTNFATFNVRRSSEIITINPLTNEQLNQNSVAVSGSVGNSNYVVTVNGVTATVNEDGTWTADGVPVNPSGLANLSVQVLNAPGGSVIASQTFSQPQPVVVELMTYLKEERLVWVTDSFCTHIPSNGDIHEAVNWSHASGGRWRSYGYSSEPEIGEFDDVEELAGGEGGYNISWEFAYVSFPTHHFSECYDQRGPFENNTRTRVMIAQTGRTVMGLIRTYLVRAKAWEVSDPENHFAQPPLPPGWLAIRNRLLTPSSEPPDENGSVWGERIVTSPGGAFIDVTPVAIHFYDYRNYVFTVQAEEIKIASLVWTNKNDNPPIEDNNNPITGTPMPGGGKRIFVGALTPNENNARNTLYLKAKLSPPTPNVRIYFRAFDVDDPSSDNTIDDNGAAGNDNFVDTPLTYHLNTGYFADNLQPDISVMTDTNGEATVEFAAGTQPGNNYRIAVTLDKANLTGLTVSSPTSVKYVSANDNQITGFGGTVSPMLTVWRKLHIEVDSMEAVATNGSEANFETGTVDLYEPNTPVSGVSKIRVSPTGTDLRGGEYAYENGRLEINGFGPLTILSNALPLSGVNYVYVEGTPGSNVVGQSFTIYDDDDRFLYTIGLPPALPKDDESTNIIEGIRSVFFPAYIDVTNANVESCNPNKRIDFKLNIGMGIITGAGVFNDEKDLHDAGYFWAHTVTFGYQDEVSSDLDPNSEDQSVGVTLKKTVLFEGGVSAIFIEAIRDAAIDDEAQNHQDDPELYPEIRTNYWRSIWGTVAHEIGHGPGGSFASSDHAEGDLMTGNFIHSIQSTTHFAPASIRRFRMATSWSN